MGITATSAALAVLGLVLTFPIHTNSSNDFLHYYNTSVPLPDIAGLYQDYCPDNSLCTTNQSRTAINGQGCCTSCSCSSRCFQEGNCCPDVLQYANETLRETCVRPQYLDYGVTPSSGRLSFYMIHRCMAEFKDTEIAEKCELIPRNPRSLEGFLYTLPATKVNSAVVYRNKYCGLCNGEDEENLVQWKMELICDSDRDMQTDSFVELLYMLNREKICNIIYINPFMEWILFPRRCQWGRFTRCNQTGNMVAYDDTLDDMCGAFTAIYARTYRNVFCFLCNVPGHADCLDEDWGVGVFHMTSFTAVLDLNVISYAAFRPQVSTETCTPSQRYDSYKDVCRNMTCAVGSIHINGACRRRYVTERQKSYDVYFRISPVTEHSACVNTSGLFSVELSASIYTMLSASSGVRNDICLFVAYFYPGKSQCDYYFSSVEYVLFHIEIYSYMPHSVDQYLTELSSLDTKLMVVGSKSFRITLDSGYYGDIVFGFPPFTQNYSDPDTKEQLVELPNFPTLDKGCPYQIRHMHVTKMSYCPRVFLPSDEYRVSLEQEQVCLESIDLCLTNGTYIQKRDGLEMCADVYFEHVQNLTWSNESSYKCTKTSHFATLGLVSFLCTSLSLFFLLLTILTYGLFKSLRTTPGKNNTFLSINLLIAQALFQFGAGQEISGVACIVVGALVHYFWLSAIVWMNICSFHMFRVFTSIKAKTMSSQRDENRWMAKYIIYSVLAPLVMVGLNSLVSLVTSDWSQVGYGGCACYISSNQMILYTFLIPIAFFVFLNMIFFVIVIIAIRRSQHSKLSSNQDQITIVVYLKLSCLTGASWVFGLLKMLINLDVFGYIFVVLTAGEGIFIFLSFICSKRVLKLYKGLVGYSDSSESSHTSRATLSHSERQQNVQSDCQQIVTRM